MARDEIEEWFKAWAKAERLLEPADPFALTCFRAGFLAARKMAVECAKALPDYAADDDEYGCGFESGREDAKEEIASALERLGEGECRASPPAHQRPEKE